MSRVSSRIPATSVSGTAGRAVSGPAGRQVGRSALGGAVPFRRGMNIRQANQAQADNAKLPPRRPIRFRSIRNAPRLAQQQAAFASGATGLQGSINVGIGEGLIGSRDAPRVGGFLPNEATLRAVARGRTARGAQVRRQLEEKERQRRQKKLQREVKIIDRQIAIGSVRSKRAADNGNFDEMTRIDSILNGLMNRRTSLFGV